MFGGHLYLPAPDSRRPSLRYRGTTGISTWNIQTVLYSRRSNPLRRSHVKSSTSGALGLHLPYVHSPHLEGSGIFFFAARPDAPEDREGPGNSVWPLDGGFMTFAQ